MKTWRINNLAPTIGLQRWQDGLASAFVRLDAELVDASEFAGRIEQAALPDGHVSRVSASAHRVIRRAEHAAHRAHDTVFANLQLSGRGEVRLPGGAVRPNPLDIVIVSTCEAYSITHNSDFDLFSFALPRAALPGGLGPGIIPLSQTAAGRELAGVLGGLGTLALQLPDAKAVIEAQIRSILALMASISLGGEGDDALRAAICAHIARMHGNAGLSAAPIAASFGLTERHLHGLFEGTGLTIGARIQQARLATAVHLLRDTSLAVSTVSVKSGFRDPGYFGRVFRRAHGVSPRDWRAAQLS